MSADRVHMSEESFPIGSLALVAMKGFEDFANQVDKWLIEFHKENFGTAPDTPGSGCSP